MQSMDLDSTFPCNYEVDEIRELPGDSKFHFPVFPFPAEAASRGECRWLKVTPNGAKPWIGAFACRYPCPPAIFRVTGTPDPSRICVISAGPAYIVKTDHPTVWEELPIMPVIETRALRSHELLLLSDFVSILAYGRDGVVWQSPRLCWDELKMGEVTRDVLEGTGYDPTGHSSGKTTMRFAVDLRTGRSLLHGPVSADGKPLW